LKTLSFDVSILEKHSSPPKNYDTTFKFSDAANNVLKHQKSFDENFEIVK
jgi:hypothetical protein